MGGLVAQVVAASDPRVRAAGFLCSVPPRGIVAIAGSCSTASSPIPGRWLARSRWAGSLQPKLTRRYRGEAMTFEGRKHLVMLEDGWESRAIRVLDWAARAVEGASVPPTP
jgi:pimeloyl-ACP methyl ester carboxylesterase